MGKTYTVDVQQCPDSDDCFIEFPLEMMNEVQWKEGDNINWADNKDGSYTLTKVEDPVEHPMEYVLVECVSTFRTRYMVQVPKGKADWALDTVTMDEAQEFSQEHLGEQIVSHRVVTKEQVLEICDQDNDYTKAWEDDKKIEVFCTPWTEDYYE